MPITPFIGRADFVAHVREEVDFARFAASAASFASSAACSAQFAVGHELHRARDPDGRARRIALGPAAQPHPFVRGAFVQEPHLDIERRVEREVLLERIARRGPVLRMQQALEARARMLELSSVEPQKLLEPRAEPELVGLHVDLPDAVARAEHGAGEPLLGRGKRGLGALQVGDVDERAGDAQDLAVRAVRDIGLLGDPALPPAGRSSRYSQR